MMKIPQTPTPQELVGARMNGMQVFSMKWIFLLIILVIDVVVIYSSYFNQYLEKSQSEDYKIIGCEVEERDTTCLLHVEVQNRNGQEQTVEVYRKSGSLLQNTAHTEILLPAYETITVTYEVDTEDIEAGLTLHLKTYEEQYWMVDYENQV